MLVSHHRRAQETTALLRHHPATDAKDTQQIGRSGIQWTLDSDDTASRVPANR
jgi:hypothetical protein